jgi:hypothetical protein
LLDSHLKDCHIIPDDYLVKTCFYRQGERCCKYIVFSDLKNEFCCVKKILKMKAIIDQAENMRAKGDNCLGLPLNNA